MRMSGGQAVVEILRQEGIEYIFGIPGATEVFFMDAMEDCPDIQYILGLHEVAAAGMAEGYARTSGRPAVLNLHTAAGLAAALPMVFNACAGGVPLIITAGQQDTRLLASDPALAGDLVGIAGPFTKWASEIAHVEDIPAVFRRAFRFAQHPPAGPVFISLPQDVMSSSLDLEYRRDSSLFTRVYPSPESVQAAARLLAGAHNPAMIVEDGVAKSGALREVVALAEITGSRVYEYWMSDVNFPLDHPLHSGDLDLTSLRTRELLEKVDVLVAVGAELFSQPVYLDSPLLTPATRIIQIDDDPRQIGKNFPVEAALEGDIRSAAACLTLALAENMTGEEKEAAAVRAKIIGEEKRRGDAAFAEKALKERDNVPISPARLMQEIRENLKPGTRIVDDCWSNSAILRRTLAFNEPGSYQRSRSGGSIGWGLPGALGVKLASPERPVVCISGDGSAMWSVQSLWTAAHYNIPVTFIICANGCYQQVRNMKAVIMGTAAQGRNLGTTLCQPQNNFCRIAEGMGVAAQRVDRPEQLKSALRQAFDLNKPNLVEVKL